MALRRAAVTIAASLVLTVAGASPAAALPIGIVSFDELIAGPDGVNAFNIANLTETFALPSDFPVIDAVSFLDASLTLTRADGGSEIIVLGDMLPGPLLDLAGFPLTTLTFSSGAAFVSATFQATLSQLTLLLADGSSIQLASSLVTASLTPLAGDTLTAGDFALIDVTPRVDPPPTEAPEAPTVLLIATGLLLWSAASRSHHRRFHR